MSEVIGYVGKPEPLKEEVKIIDVEATVVEEAPKKAKKTTKQE